MERKSIIIRNRARCTNCGDIVESRFQHEFVPCSCYQKSNGKTGIYVDGGKSYLRAGGDLDHFESLSETRLMTDEERDAYNARQFDVHLKYGFEYDPME